MKSGLGLVLVLMLGSAGVVSAQVDADDAANKPAEIEPLAAGSLLLDLAQAGSRLVAVGERGHVLLSDDQGATWRQARSVPTRVMLTAVFFADNQYGWAVGHDETILNTVDGGETWTRSHFAPEAQQPLLDLWFANRVSGIAVGAYGAYFTTNDGGRTWASAKFAPPPVKSQATDDIPQDYHLNRIIGVGNRLYIAAEAASSTARTIAAPTGARCHRLRRQFLRPGADPRRGLLAFGLRGHLYRSADGGETWTQLESHTSAMLTDGMAINDLRVVIGGLAGVLLVSGDAGETFRLTQQDDRKGISALLPGPSGAAVVAGEGGVRVLGLDAAPEDGP
jgi:photosystem II stability/assembly factor-like uncharacterized protein